MAESPLVLCVEDDPVSRDVCVRRLRARNFRVHSVTNGVECLDWLLWNACDLILLDLTMPRMDGIECVRRIRETFTSDVLPVIMVSGHVDTDHIVAGLNAGANDYVVKPIDVPVLEARIRNCLKMRGAMSELIEAERQRVMIETLGRSAARLAEPIARMIDTLERFAGSTPPAAETNAGHASLSPDDSDDDAASGRHEPDAAPASPDCPPETPSPRTTNELEGVLGLVEEFVGVMEKLQAAGREANVPYSRRLDLLVGQSSRPDFPAG